MGEVNLEDLYNALLDLQLLQTDILSFQRIETVLVSLACGIMLGVFFWNMLK